MRLFAYLGVKSLIAAAAIGLLAGLCAWGLLPPVPRVTIPTPDRRGRIAFSADCKLFAYASGEHTSRRLWNGELRVWDTQEPRQLFSTPYSESYPPVLDGGYSMAFTPDGEKLVTFSWGEAKFYQVPSGEPWEPQESRKFPSDGMLVRSQLVEDAHGNVFVRGATELATLPQHKTSIFDLWTGARIAAADWRVGDALRGGLISYPHKDRVCLHEVPTCKLRLDVKQAEVYGEFVCTPDCRTLVQVYGKATTWRDGEGPVKHSIPISQFPVVSPDGELLGGLVPQLHAYGDWRTKLLNAVRLHGRESTFVVYDLSTDKPVASFPHAQHGHFSLDGKTLAVFAEDTVELYDLPLSSPWLRVVAVALVGAIAAFGVGQWLRWRQSRMPAPAPVPQAHA
jgi:hypothetical protein